MQLNADGGNYRICPPGKQNEGLAVPLHLTMEELDHPHSLMNLIAGNTEQADPFCCRTEWQFSFHETFSPARTLYFRNSNDSMIAFAGYEYPDTGFVLEPIESYWLFGNPLLGPNAVELLKSLLSEGPFCGSRPLVVLSGLVRGSSLLREVLLAFKDQYEIIRLEPSGFRCASLSGGMDGYLSRRSAKLRRNLRRTSSQLADKGVVFERCIPLSIEQSDDAYARMLYIEETSWKGIGQCGMTIQPSLDFYRLMLRRMSCSGIGRIIFARHEGKDIGFIFGGITGSYYRGQQFSYSEEWSKYSIGNILQLEQIRWLCEEGIGRYDMGQTLDYKAHWTEIELQTENLLLRPMEK